MATNYYIIPQTEFSYQVVFFWVDQGGEERFTLGVVSLIHVGFSHVQVQIPNLLHTLTKKQNVATGRLRPVYIERKHLRFSVYFNVESVCIHHWCQWVSQTQTLGVNRPSAFYLRFFSLLRLLSDKICIEPDSKIYRKLIARTWKPVKKIASINGPKCPFTCFTLHIYRNLTQAENKYSFFTWIKQLIGSKTFDLLEVYETHHEFGPEVDHEVIGCTARPGGGYLQGIDWSG